jgi:hypothetical protein
LATQGVVSIRQRGKVVMKLIAGSNGDRAVRVATAMRNAIALPTSQEAYDLANRCGFGHVSDLVVMTETEVVFYGDDELPDLYRRTFDDPTYNPRWERGIADHVKIIDL